MADGDRDMEQTMLEMLISELPEEFEKMRSHLAAQEWDRLGKVSHKMKSTLAFIGNDEITNANREIEQSAKHLNNLERIPELMSIFAEHLPAVMEELNRTLGEY
jgi:HPt (histidine-containing phosphotransfer) domain-containing protein